MQIKAGQLIGMVNELELLVKRSLYIGDSLQIARMAKKLASEANIIKTQHQELLKKYADVEPDGKLKIIEENGTSRYSIPDDKIQDFQKEFIELSNTVLDIDIEPYKLQKPESLDEISPEEILNICELITV